MSAPVSVQLRCQRGHKVAPLSLWDEGPDDLPRLALTPRLRAAVTPAPVERTTSSGPFYRDGTRWQVTCPVCGAVSTVWAAALAREALAKIRAGQPADVRLP